MKAKEQKSIFMVSFDLDTKLCGRFFNDYTQAYGVVKQAMKKEGFIHRQGSTYFTEKETTQARTLGKLKYIFKNNLWLKLCCKKIDLGAVKYFEAKEFLTELTPKEEALLNKLSEGFNNGNKHRNKGDDNGKTK